jgi:hypothetical protein
VSKKTRISGRPSPDIENDAEALKEARKQDIRNRGERIADQIKVTDAARIRYAQQLSDPANKVSGAELAALARIEALLEGEATDRVERADLDRELQRWIEAARSHMSEEEFQAFLDELERLVDDDRDSNGAVSEARPCHEGLAQARDQRRSLPLP